ncbi:trypsin-5-like isoform X2 [Culex pipiens pallens]|uniref:trypsin-5-like isoform X2 n=1 Tax=Culex pipiens pallens TaxID=42434 RepID=UPI0022AB4A1B|nr:trypsin-5-like isoform X2 [Culex pipiens pallens]
MTVAVKLFWFVIFIGGGEIHSVYSFHAPETSRIHYVASLENDGGQFCSGCVLGTRWILTLASCVRHVSPVDISVGIQPQDSSSSGHHEKVQNIYVQPNGKSKKEGLAILKLKRSMNWVNRTLPIAVMDNYHDLTSVSQCIMLGWNRNREDLTLAENVRLNCTNSTKGTFCVHDHRANFCEVLCTNCLKNKFEFLFINSFIEEVH